MLVDSHCHLDILEFDKLAADTDKVLQDAAAHDVGYFLCVSIDLETYPQVLALAEKYPNVYASVGVHPNAEVQHEAQIADLVERAAHRRVIAIGETGLDYYRSEGDLEWQRERFRCHIRAAKHAAKPLIVHCREAKEDTLRLLREEGAHEIGGVMHCFVDDWDTAKAAMDMNFFISFSGIVTFKSAAALREVAKRMPLDRILVETDSPYLAPVPFRGKTNQPAYVRYVAESIASLRDEPFEAFATATTENFFGLFAAARRVT